MIATNRKNHKQQTIKDDLSFKGVGLHTGQSATVTIAPSESNTGITFIRTDIKKDNQIKALWFNVSSTILSTTFGSSLILSKNILETSLLAAPTACVGAISFAPM